MKVKEMEVGKWNKLPHYAILGGKTDMYVWVNEDGKGSASQWIKGNIAFRLWHRLEKRFKKDKKAFVELLKTAHLNNKEADDLTQGT